MAPFILAAPDAAIRFTGDYRHQYREVSYTEAVEVVDGICRCVDESTKTMLVRKGYKLLDPSFVCHCGHVSLSGAEAAKHRKTHIKRKPRL
ncbi:unnamed protein product [marine sediment metagenome]|uniref:Uncharacterized protein n=1 Tax=marine sediment metagenome TaxID=412755 RepID=X1EVN6_9ZZZZ